MNDIIKINDTTKQQKLKIFERAINNEKLTKTDILNIYGNPDNWEQQYDEFGCKWVWRGPTTCAYELAQYNN